MKHVALGTVLAAVGLLAAERASACGAPFGAGMNVDPQQDILLVHKGGEETYVFQPTFCGDAKDFGVILPVPALLSTAPALGDAKAFAAADTISAPKVEKKTECRNRGVGGISDAGSFGDSDGTKVVSSGTVGFLDWVQLEAKDAASFTSWLDANGYPYDAKAKATFDYYVAKKWFFVAFKVTNGVTPPGGNNCKSLGPIKLGFKTAVPVVPSRMATAGAMVPKAGGFGPPGFSWRIFAITSASEQLAFSAGNDSTRKIGFTGALDATDVAKLDGLAAAGDRMTKLTLWFDASHTEDVALKTTAAADFRETLYDVTYVDCPDAGPIGDDAGPGPDPTAAAPTASDKGCSSSGTSSSTFRGFFALGALALLRRRSGHLAR